MKYIVIELDVNENDIIIMDVFEDKKVALEYLLKSTTEEFNDKWHKIQINKEDQISVYKLGYIMEKQLVYKYFIKECKKSDDLFIQFDMD